MHSTDIRPRTPFDFETTARFLRFTEAEIVDNFDAGIYTRALYFEGRLFLLTINSEGTRARPSLRVSLTTPRRDSTRTTLDRSKVTAWEVTTELLAEAEQAARQMFSIEHDLKKFRAQIQDDPLLGRLEAEHRGLHLPRWASLFEALANSILLQQIATSVAWTFRRRLVERFGERLTVDDKKFYAFPLPSSLARSPVEALRALGLSGAKAQSIIELARACEEGRLDGPSLAREDNETIIARLSALRGVGRWTAEWVLMLHFGRTDVFAAADLFLRGAVVKYYNNGQPMSEREIRELARRRWGPWQSYVALYLLAGMRVGSVTLKPERVLSSAQPDA
ncbi:MAG: DNA-3-methyladenine glycosylase [Acidobacteriota bacterium]|nr:DNA-3-methyladenine glycosylase [Acidobacteriota bacterium]